MYTLYTKFYPGDTIYYMYYGEVREARIKEIRIRREDDEFIDIYYTTDGTNINAEFCFKTKRQALKSLIEKANEELSRIES